MALEIEWGKLLVLLVTVVGVVVLGALGVLSEGSILGILGTVVGYTAGNGRLAAKGRTPVPMLGRRQYRRTGDDT